MRNFPQLATFVIAGLVVATNVQAFSPSAIDLPTLNLSAGEGIDFNGNTVNITSGYVLRKNQVESTDQNFSFTGNQVLVDGNLSVGGGSTTPSEVLVVNGNIVPATGNTGSLGTASNPWKDLYVSSSTIFVGNLRLQDVGGSLSIVNEETPEANVGIIVGSSEGTTEVVSQEGGGIATSSLPDGGDWTLDTDLNLIASGTLDNIISIGADGNVGIGTTTPSDKLEIVGGNGNQLTLDNAGETWTQQNFNNNNVAKTYIALDSTNKNFIIGAQNSYSDFDRISFRPDGSNDDMVIKRAGNVGIGTTGPDTNLHVFSSSADAELTVESTNSGGDGRLNLFGNSGGVSQIRFGDESDINIGLLTYDHTSDEMQFRTADVQQMVIDNTGNVGIGTTTPDVSLQVSKATDPNIKIQSSTDDGQLMLGYNTTGDYGAFSTKDGGTWYGNTMTLKGGNVGIGTTAPGYKLDVNGNSRITGDLTVTGTSYLGNIVLNADNITTKQVTATNSEGLKLFEDGGTGIFIKDGGNVGIGTTAPVYALDVIGRIRSSSSVQILNSGELILNSSGGFATISNPSTQELAFKNTTSEAMRINAAGNVGIGTTAPGVKFVVQQGSPTGLGAFNTSQDTIGVDSEQAYNFIDFRGGATQSQGLMFTDGTRGRGNIQYLHTDDAMIFSTGGVGEQVRIDNTGNVGIGTTTPNSLTSGAVGGTVPVALHVDGPSGTGRLLVSGASSAEVWLSNLGAPANDKTWYQSVDTSGVYKMQTVTDDYSIENNVLAMTNTGNVGIGTTTPSGKLHVSAAVYSGANAGGNGAFRALTNTGSQTINIDAAGVSYFNGGKVGIGTTGPKTELHLSKANGVNIRLSDNTAATDEEVNSIVEYYRGDDTNRVGYMGFGSSGDSDIEVLNAISGGNIELYTTGAGDVTIPNGNIGIGTTTPSSVGGFNKTLVVEGTSASLVLVDNDAAAGGNPEMYEIGSAGGRLVFTADGAERMRIDENGNVGIGTTAPGAKLDVAGRLVVAKSDVNTILMQSEAPTAVGEITSGITFGKQSGFYDGYRVYGVNRNTGNGSADLYFDRYLNTSAHETVLALNQYGNVGIGTTAPEYKLEVNGASAFRNIMRIGAVGDDSGIMTFGGGPSNAFNIMAGSNKVLMLGAGGTYTNGMIINTGGNVGIGTTAPDTALHVNGAITAGAAGATSGTTILESNYGDGTNDNPNVIGTQYSSAAWQIGYGIRPKSGSIGYVSSVDNSNWQRSVLEVGNGLSFSSAPAQTTAVGDDITGLETRFTILNNGNVGIGTTNPVAGLEVSPNMTVSGPAPRIRITGPTGVDHDLNGWGSAGVLGFSADSNNEGTDPAIGFSISSSEKMRITDGGNVGIGTTAPGNKLSVYLPEGSDNITNTYLASVYNAEGTIDSGWGLLVRGGGNYSAQNTFAVQDWSGNTDFVVKGDGNVGIGTTGPNVPLSVKGGSLGLPATSGTAQTNGIMRLNNSGVNNAVLDIGMNGTNGAWIQHADATNLGVSYPLLLNPNGGNVGIGTTDPGAKLDVLGGVRFGSFSGDNDMYLGTSIWGSGTALVRLGGWNSGEVWNDMMVINPRNGNVGIGTTAPGADFHVNAGGTTLPTSIGGNTSAIFQNNASTASSNDVIIVAGSASTANLNFSDNTGDYRTMGRVEYDFSTDAMTLQAGNVDTMTLTSGNVGIGTTGPEGQFEVFKDNGVGNVDSSFLVDFDGANSNRRLTVSNVGGTGMSIQADTISTDIGTDLVLNPAGGNVGIGTTTPGAKLEIITGTTGGHGEGIRISRPVAGTNYHSLEFATAGTVDWSLGQNANDSFEIYENGVSATTRFTIKEGGNVGIGTTTPKRALHVETDISTAPIRFEGSNGWVELQIIDGSSCSAGWVKIGEDGGNSFCFDSGG